MVFLVSFRAATSLAGRPRPPRRATTIGLQAQVKREALPEAREAAMREPARSLRHASKAGHGNSLAWPGRRGRARGTSVPINTSPLSTT